MRRLVWLCALMAFPLSSGAAADPKNWRGTWAATDIGRSFQGSWTATIGDDPNVATGTWTVLNAAGKHVLSGTWSARKSAKGWEGAWQARTASNRILAGTWTGKVPIVSPAGFAEMFDFALSNVTNGGWQAGQSRSGAWSIRAYPER